MQHTRKQQVPKETITSSDTTTLKEFDQKTTLFQAMTNFKSFNRFLKQRALYHALIELIFEDEDVMENGVADKLKKRKPHNTSATKNSSKGKTLATSSKPSKPDKSTKGQVVEPVSMQDSNNAEHDDADYANMPMDQGEVLGNMNEQPNNEAVYKNDWYKKSRSDPSPDPEWNKIKSIDNGPKQSWLNDMDKATKPPLTFDDLTHTPI
nr:hypothetical protein [Tanacetum cinerariifolium]GEY67247.1 hypothetical protein [Tanacetum cinerariifolium]GEY67250.1 hypothetical protein [Tanacetum cinerariifolium]